MLLYIHIPFCDSKCFYCAFNSYTSLHSLRNDYMEALYLELKIRLEKHNTKIETIFIGGGTPSTIKAHKYKNLSKSGNIMKNRESTATDILFSQATKLHNNLAKNRYTEDLTGELHNTEVDNTFGENKYLNRHTGRLGSRAVGRNQFASSVNNYNEFVRSNTKHI